MSRFLLLLHRSASTVSGDNPEALRERIQKYKAWREEMTRQGKILAGEKCTGDDALWLRKSGGEVVIEPSNGNGDRDIISGYFLLQADDRQEASEIARHCPHVEYGGTIELLQIEPTS
jgi:hypothetical protein